MNDGLALFSFCFLMGCLYLGFSMQKIDIDVIYKQCGTERPFLIIEDK